MRKKMLILLVVGSMSCAMIGCQPKRNENYQKMINEEDYDKDLLEELTIYDSVALQPNRKKCALLPKVTIEKILEKLK